MGRPRKVTGSLAESPQKMDTQRESSQQLDTQTESSRQLDRQSARMLDGHTESFQQLDRQTESSASAASSDSANVVTGSWADGTFSTSSPHVHVAHLPRTQDTASPLDSRLQQRPDPGALSPSTVRQSCLKSPPRSGYWRNRASVGEPKSQVPAASLLAPAAAAAASVADVSSMPRQPDYPYQQSLATTSSPTAVLSCQASASSGHRMELLTRPFPTESAIRPGMFSPLVCAATTAVSTAVPNNAESVIPRRVSYPHPESFEKASSATAVNATASSTAESMPPRRASYPHLESFDVASSASADQCCCCRREHIRSSVNDPMTRSCTFTSLACAVMKVINTTAPSNAEFMIPSRTNSPRLESVDLTVSATVSQSRCTSLQSNRWTHLNSPPVNEPHYTRPLMDGPPYTRPSTNEPQHIGPFVNDTRPLTKEPHNTRPLRNEVHHSEPLTSEVHHSGTLTNEVRHSRPLTNEVHHSGPLTNEPSHNRPFMNEPHHIRPFINESFHTRPLTNEPQYTTAIMNEPRHIGLIMNEPHHTGLTMNEPHHTRSLMNRPRHRRPLVNGPYLTGTSTKEPHHTRSLATEPYHIRLVNELHHTRSLVNELQHTRSLASEPHHTKPLVNQPHTTRLMTTEPLIRPETSSSLAATATNPASVSSTFQRGDSSQPNYFGPGSRTVYCECGLLPDTRTPEQHSFRHQGMCGYNHLRFNSPPTNSSPSGIFKHPVETTRGRARVIRPYRETLFSCGSCRRVVTEHSSTKEAMDLCIRKTGAAPLAHSSHREYPSGHDHLDLNNAQPDSLQTGCCDTEMLSGIVAKAIGNVEEENPVHDLSSKPLDLSCRGRSDRKPPWQEQKERPEDVKDTSTAYSLRDSFKNWRDNNGVDSRYNTGQFQKLFCC